FVFFSSAAVYGKDGVAREEQIPEPKSLYGATKIGGEYYVRVFANLHGFRPIIMRCFNIYGPRQRWDELGGVISRFTYSIIKGEKTYIRGDGSAVRDYIYVSDVVDALIHLVEKNECTGIYNIGTGIPATVLEVHRMISEALNIKAEPTFLPSSPDEMKYSIADISKLLQTGFKPSISLKDGISKTVKYYKQLLT
ncbi:MAG: NAD-dependent epimerase/dehydratase family protein, partial [Candidatus Korarchaeota archaeon]